MLMLRRYVIPKTMNHWKDIAFHSLCYDSTMVEQIEKDCASDPERCCNKLFEDWLTTDNGVSPKTWETLLTQLEKVKEFGNTSREIRENLILKI